MGRIGCAVCGKVLGPFAYKAVGLCNPCRRRVAKQVGKLPKQVSCSTIGLFVVTRNLTKQEVDAYFSPLDVQEV